MTSIILKAQMITNAEFLVTITKERFDQLCEYEQFLQRLMEDPKKWCMVRAYGGELKLFPIESEAALAIMNLKMAMERAGFKNIDYPEQIHNT